MKIYADPKEYMEWRIETSKLFASLDDYSGIAGFIELEYKIYCKNNNCVPDIVGLREIIKELKK